MSNGIGLLEIYFGKKPFPNFLSKKPFRIYFDALPRARRNVHLDQRQLQSWNQSIRLTIASSPNPGRDGGTGRRSGLKIRRCLAPWGFNSPSRHQNLTRCSSVVYATFASRLRLVQSTSFVPVPSFVPLGFEKPRIRGV